MLLPWLHDSVITMQHVVYKMKAKGADIETVTVDVDDYAIIELM